MFLLVLFFVKFHIRIRSNIAIVGLFVLLSLSLLLLVLPSFVGILDICLVGILVIEAHLCLLEIIIRLETMIRRRSIGLRIIRVQIGVTKIFSWREC